MPKLVQISINIEDCVSQNRREVSCSLRFTRRLHEENHLRFSNSTHFRLYWTKKHFISAWYFTKKHEIGSLVVRTVKKSWDSRQNRELRPASRNCWSFGHVYRLDKSKSFKISYTSVSKLAIVLIWNIQSPHEDNRPVPPVKCTKSAHRGMATITRDSCRSDIGRFRAEPTDLPKVSTSGWHICISQCPQ